MASALADGEVPPSTPIAILSQTQEINGDGSFSSQFETANGISEQVEGSVKKIDDKTEIQVIKGSFSWTDADGVVRKLSYVADENGYQPQADFLPTTPAVPLPIQRALQYAAEHPEVTTVVADQWRGVSVTLMWIAFDNV